jgi:hypothetical protein
MYGIYGKVHLWLYVNEAFYWINMIKNGFKKSQTRLNNIFSFKAC